MQALDAAADERARRRHGDARLLARNRQHAAVGDGRQRFIEAAGDHCSERDDFARVAIPVYLLAISQPTSFRKTWLRTATVSPYPERTGPAECARRWRRRLRSQWPPRPAGSMARQHR